ncbi:MAG: DNA helicase [Planctomycetota bacterium]|nr:MAG: DNA helicase [Planctomycetota bacterium]
MLAGAGSGKTRVITTRAAYLLERGVPAENVMAVTFTNKAAREMRARLGKLVGKQRAAAMSVGTFHSWCVQLLRAHPEAAGLHPNFTICDAAEQLSVVRGVQRELHGTASPLKPGSLLSRISLLKNRLVSPEQAEDTAADELERFVARAYARYNETLSRQRCVDFDDLLVRGCQLLESNESLRAELGAHHRYVMVDEYQDTNGPQDAIVNALARDHRNLCVVGDDDQAIYAWRGADITRILAFEERFPGSTVVRLETNYRSTAEILAAANRVIACNGERHTKELRSAVGPGEQPRIESCPDEIEEASFLVRDILRSIRLGASAGDIAILYRTQQQPRPIELALREAELPYTLVGGMSWFDRKEVRDVLAYVRLLANPDDESSWLRVANRPPRGLGKTSMDRILAVATERDLPLSQAVQTCLDEGLLSRAAADGAEDLHDTLAELGVNDPGGDMVQRLGSLIDRVDYKVEVERCYPDASVREDRWRAVLEVLDMAENYVTRAKRPRLTEFLDRLSLATNNDNTPDDPEERTSITLMTLHGAKGLEFPVVYLPGVEEALLPHQRAVDEDTIEEERRLMYVGITRARRRLVISCAASRSLYGSRRQSMPSRFLYEMAAAEPPEGWQAARPRSEASAPRRSKPDKPRRKRVRRAESL